MTAKFETLDRKEIASHLIIVPLAARPEYLETVIAWNIKEWGSCWPDAYAVTSKHYRARLNKDMPPIAFIALLQWQDQEIPVGSLSLVEDIYQLLPLPHTYWRSRAIIPESFRGLGIGTLLRAKVDEFAVQQGIRTFYTFLIEGQQSRLYQHALATGFQPIMELKGEQARGIDIFGYPYDFGHVIILKRTQNLVSPA